MRKLTIFVATGLLLVFHACQKESNLPPISETPVFFVAFSTDGVKDSVTAGLNNQYLFTRITSIAQDSQVSISAFAPENCPEGSCPGSLRLELHGTFTDTTRFGPGFYAYTATTPTSYVGAFTVQNANLYDQFSAVVNSNVIFEGDNTTGTRTFDNLTPLEVQLTARKFNNLYSFISRFIDPINPVKYPAVSLTLLNLPNNGGYQITAHPTQGSGQPSYLWSTGDTSSVIQGDSLSSFYSVTVSDMSGKTASAYFENISPQIAQLPSATLDFTANFTTPPLSNTVAVQWVDAQGVVWRSDRTNQPPDSYFNILSSAPYEANENGLPTQKKRVSFLCQLFNNAGQSRVFFGEGVVAVAYLN